MYSFGLSFFRNTMYNVNYIIAIQTQQLSNQCIKRVENWCMYIHSLLLCCPRRKITLGLSVMSPNIIQLTEDLCDGEYERLIWPWSTEWSRAKASRLLPRERTGHSKHPLPTTREDYTWTSSDGQHRNQIDYILCSQRGEALYSQQKQDQELTVAQTINSLLPNSDLNWRK